MLTRIWIGLFISLFNVALQTTFSLLLKEQYFDCPEIYKVEIIVTLPRKCYLALASYNVSTNSSCELLCSDFMDYLSKY